MGDELSDFAKKIRAVGARVPENAAEGVRKLALRISQVLVVETPVKTGQARNNWFATVGSPSDKIVEGTEGAFDKTGAARIVENSEEIQTAPMKEGSSIYITNNLPYISKLNDGSSAQAPKNFVETAVITAEQSMKDIDLLKEK